MTRRLRVPPASRIGAAAGLALAGAALLLAGSAGRGASGDRGPDVPPVVAVAVEQPGSA